MSDIPVAVCTPESSLREPAKLIRALAGRDANWHAADDMQDLYLGGISVRDLQAEFGLDLNYLQPHVPAEQMRLADAGVEVHYLGYYLWSTAASSRRRSARQRRTAGTTASTTGLTTSTTGRRS